MLYLNKKNLKISFKKGVEMKKNYWLLMVLIAFIAGLMLSQLLVQAEESKSRKLYEYKVEILESKDFDEFDQERTINRLHREGWELFEVSSISADGWTKAILMYFKKAI